MKPLWALVLSLLVVTSAPVARAEGEPSLFPKALEAGQWYSAFGIHVTGGLAFGGETLAELTYSDGTQASLHAGEGVYVMGGLSWTPLWLSQRVGLGLSLDAGYKFKSTYVGADGSVHLSRVPAAAMVRSLVGLGKSWHVVGAAGLAAEFSPKFRGDGVLSSVNANFNDALGLQAEVGILGGRPHAFGWEITGIFTYMRYGLGSASFDASHGAINFGLHYFL